MLSLLFEARRFVTFVDFVCCQICIWKVRKRGRIWRTRDVAADCGVFRLSRSNVEWCSFFNESEKLRSHVVVHADAAVCAWVRLHPTSVKTIARLELSPVRHRSSDELGASRLISEVATSVSTVSVVEIAMRLSATVFLFTIHGEVTLWGWGGACAN